MSSKELERLGAKFKKENADKFRNFCNNRGENISSVLRRLVLTELAKHSFLSKEEKKALGVVSNG